MKMKVWEEMRRVAQEEKKTYIQIVEATVKRDHVTNMKARAQQLTNAGYGVAEVVERLYLEYTATDEEVKAATFDLDLPSVFGIEPAEVIADLQEGERLRF